MGSPGDSPLGKATVYGDRYDPGLLYAVERAPQRATIGLAGAALPFHGADAWTVWEASWRDRDGRPRVAVVRFDVPASSPAIVESKSVKLYFTALNDTRFDDPAAFRATVARDLAAATGGEVLVTLVDVDDAVALARGPLEGRSIDDAPFTDPSAARVATLTAREAPAAAPPTPMVPIEPDGAMLRVSPVRADETLTTRLFRSVCPVTGQPDYAQLAIRYRGRALDRAALLAYLVAFRHHAGFHEHCVERIFVDVAAAAMPERLAVVARFTRRGGIDINPLRSLGDRALATRPTLQQ